MKIQKSGHRQSLPKMCRVILLAALFIYMDLSSVLWAQTDAIHNDRILAPEVSHFLRPTEPGVDAHGDLSLSIPLMTVPGRDGLNFDIVANYRSGIQVKQSASWIGLGWSLDIGSVTRHPLGVLNSEPQADWTRATSGQITSQPDVYMVNMNGASALLISTTLTSPYLPFEPHASDSTQKYFVPSPWRPWKINYTTANPVTVDGSYSTGTSDSGSGWTNPIADFSKFTITTEDGTRYIYGLPTLSEAYFPKQSNPNAFEYSRFVSTWRLQAILAPNYSGPEIPDATSSGGWVRIEYQTKDHITEATETVDTVLDYNNVHLLAQTTFPYKVETPTHYALFTTSKRYDRDLAKLGGTGCSVVANYNRKLDKITLYKSGTPISEVSFAYMDNGAPVNVPDDSAKLDSMLSKLSLKKITITGMNGGASLSFPSYKFAYYDTTLSWNDLACSTEPLKDFQDDFGYYWHDPQNPDAPTYDDRDGRMWSLKEITYPDGGRHLIQYENDVLNLTDISYWKYDMSQAPITYSFVFDKSFKRLRQGGPRVKRLIQYDGYDTNGDSVAFSYGTGYHSGIPETWFIKWGGFNNPVFFSGDRGQFNVTYEWIEKILNDASRIKTFYKTGNGPEPQMLYLGGARAAILHGNTRWNWGEVDRVEHRAASTGNPLVKEEIWYSSFKGLVEGQQTVAVIAPQLPYGTSSLTPAIYLNFTHKQLDSLVTQYYFGSNQIVSRESYKYTTDGTLLNEKTETSGHGKLRNTRYRYAHEVSTSPPYSGMRDRNMRSQVAQVTIDRVEEDETFSSTATTWKDVGGKYLPDREFHWRKSTSPSFLGWFNWTSPPGSNDWILTQTFDQYDQHGNTKRIIGAYGGADSTTIRWDATGTLIDSIKTRPNATTTLTTKYGYDANTFRLISITDPNNQKTEYKYDPLQRLIETINPDKKTAATQSYSYSRQTPGSGDNFVTTNPNFVRTVACTHAEHVRNYDFENGSGSIPESWSLTNGGSGVGTWDNTTSYSGLKCLKAYIPSASGSNRVLWKATFDEKVSSQEICRMEIWVKKLSGSSGGSVSIDLKFHDTNHAVTETKNKTISVSSLTTSWQKFSLDFSPLTTSDHLYEVSIDFTANSYGTVWYDRFNFYELNISKNFADGLGRDIETVQFEGNTRSTQAATYYDFADRVSKVTKPFLSADTSFTLTLSGTATIAIDSASQWYATKHKVYTDPNEYDISYPTTPDAFSETVYYSDPLNRVKYQYFPGTAFEKANPSAKYVKHTYGTNLASEMGFSSANKVLETRAWDENGVQTVIYTDTFGNKVGVRTDSGATISSGDTTKLATAFRYDILNNLTKVAPPRAFDGATNTIPNWSHAFCDSMAYNTLSQLTKRITPDAGTSEYLYDKKGNLRFVKDAKGAAGSYFIYNKYDNLGRQIEEGTMSNPGTYFNQTKADSQAFPLSGTWKIKYHYDTAGYGASVPQRNLKGRMDAIEYVTDRFPNVKGYIFYSYDNNGNVEWIEQYIPKGNVNDGNGQLATRIEYQYDALGKVTKMYFRRSFPPGASPDAFYVWYDYDNLGRLERVYTNTTDVKPTTSFNAQYTYWPSGQVKRLLLGNTVQGLDYLYNSRGWLTQINHHSLLANKDPGNDSTMVTKDRFGEIIGYNKQKYIASDAQFSSGPSGYAPQYNGNISWITLNTLGNTNPVGFSTTGWIFRYDKANRLGKANWGYLNANDWIASLRYDVTGPTAPDSLIRYDRNGNLLAMIRRDQNSGTSNGNFTYSYTANTNKLDRVSGLNGQGAGNYVYDANGNMTKDIVKLGSSSTIAYDYRNLPTQVPKTPAPAGTIYYGYDGNGQRVSKNNLFYIPDAQGRVIAVYDGASPLSTHLYWNVWGLDLIGQRYWKP